MLRDQRAVLTLAVKDLEVAKKFYEETLELKPSPRQHSGALSYDTPHATIFIYVSQFAGTNQATALTWIVDQTETVVAELEGKGVAFEHYDDLSNTVRKGHVHLAGPRKLAWFKDPDGNIHAIAGN